METLIRFCRVSCDKEFQVAVFKDFILEKPLSHSAVEGLITDIISRSCNMLANLVGLFARRCS